MPRKAEAYTKTLSATKLVLVPDGGGDITKDVLEASRGAGGEVHDLIHRQLSAIERVRCAGDKRNEFLKRTTQNTLVLTSSECGD